ncbi:MAG: RAD55 family ATPase, partial [Gaiellaceae bacterium]
ARAEGRLLIYHLPEGILSLDVLGAAVRSALAEQGVRRVAIDSLAELVYSARESARFPAYARQLAAFVRNAGATGVITSETATLGPLTEPLGGLSFLFHNVVLFRYIEQNSELGLAVTVLKMRDSDHDRGLRQFTIDERGLTIGDRLEGLTGVLGWTALREGPPPRA